MPTLPTFSYESYFRPEWRSQDMEPILDNLIRLAICVGLLLFTLHLGSRMLGVGQRAVRKITNAVLDCLGSILILPFRAVTWFAHRLFRK